MSTSFSLTPEQLDRYVPLQCLDLDARRRLLQQSTLIEAPAGERLHLEAQEALYLLQGRVELVPAADQEALLIEAGDPLARHRLSPALHELRCASHCQLLSVDPELLDLLLSLMPDEDGLQLGNCEDGEPDWMAALLSLPSFQRVAPLQLQAMFLRMQAIHAEPGELIVREHEPGDYFYVIVSGRCTVSQLRDGYAQPLAELQAGSCFGEEALLADQPRNASVTMLSRGKLMRLAKSDFQELLRAPIEARIPAGQALLRVRAQAARLLDVRSAQEFAHDGIEGALNLPLTQLREHGSSLDAKQHWIVCCDTTRRSSVAVFLLAQRGLRAVLLDGGLPALRAQMR
ncbi:Rhodanese-like domain-containing protein [Solimonas aquatica]|uniref:Rhodanese-like domain-containing protein n=1 Tax=Solimonas aquatica TaxID=489703 RepID=A0A1H9HSV4_9GAMM|nr:cyclic nucleotide-binding domain-containing protein [Solimonas aquatica]SEQ65385.1 Rhodanese-like domain-containing protein [Solimonas aquatica]